MTIPTFVPPVRPSPGTAIKPKLNILAAEFGDGYSQPTPNGYNHIREEVSLGWDALTEDQMRQIYDFLVDRGGTQAFSYAISGFSARKWTCNDFDAKLADGVWNVTAKLKQSRTLEV